MFASHPERWVIAMRNFVKFFTGVVLLRTDTASNRRSNPLEIRGLVPRFSQRKPHGGAFPHDETDHKEATAPHVAMCTMPLLSPQMFAERARLRTPGASAAGCVDLSRSSCRLFGPRTAARGKKKQVDGSQLAAVRH